MSYCVHCGTELNEDDRFCPNCGAPVTDENPDSYYIPQTFEPVKEKKEPKPKKTCPIISFASGIISFCLSVTAICFLFSGFYTLDFILTVIAVIFMLPILPFGILGIIKNRRSRKRFRAMCVWSFILLILAAILVFNTPGI